MRGVPGAQSDGLMQGISAFVWGVPPQLRRASKQQESVTGALTGTGHKTGGTADINTD